VLEQARQTQLLSSRVFTSDGVRVYENIQRIGKGLTASVKIERQLLADGRFYVLSALRLSGDTNQDTEIQAALSSFHFLSAPKSPISFGFGRFGLLGVVAILVVIGVGVFLVARRRQI
jgi:hypothetical protein